MKRARSKSPEAVMRRVRRSLFALHSERLEIARRTAGDPTNNAGPYYSGIEQGVGMTLQAFDRAMTGKRRFSHLYPPSLCAKCHKRKVAP